MRMTDDEITMWEENTDADVAAGEVCAQAREANALQSDIENAHKCAREYVPDYPFQQKDNRASEAVWACGESYKGVCRANDDLHAELATLRTRCEKLEQALLKIIDGENVTQYKPNELRATWMHESELTPDGWADIPQDVKSGIMWAVRIARAAINEVPKSE